jgi:biopolymer transport protein TolQ
MEGQLDIFQILLDSGFVVKFVLLILIACSVYSWSIILKKRGQIQSVIGQDEKLQKDISAAQSIDQLNQLTLEYPHSSVSRMLKYGIMEYESLKKSVPDIKKHFGQFGFGAIERSLSISSEHSAHELGKHLPALASIGSVSPFIGLFGTVWGIINSFSGLSAGNASLDAVAPGIAEALVATAIGLAAAIPAVWFYNKFQTEINSIQQRMQSVGQELLNFIEKDIY